MGLDLYDFLLEGWHLFYDFDSHLHWDVDDALQLHLDNLWDLYGDCFFNFNKLFLHKHPIHNPLNLHKLRISIPERLYIIPYLGHRHNLLNVILHRHNLLDNPIDRYLDLDRHNLLDLDLHKLLNLLHYWNYLLHDEVAGLLVDDGHDVLHDLVDFDDPVDDGLHWDQLLHGLLNDHVLLDYLWDDPVDEYDLLLDYRHLHDALHLHDFLHLNVAGD